MSVNLFGVPYGRSTDVDWFDNPHKAVKQARDAKVRKIIWLCYDPEHLHPMYKRPAWQSVFTVTDFEKRHLRGFAPEGANVWQS